MLFELFWVQNRYRIYGWRRFLLILCLERVQIGTTLLPRKAKNAKYRSGNHRESSGH